MDPLEYLHKINFNTRNFPPSSQVTQTFPTTGTLKVSLCRCWQSSKFPFCDDTHKSLYAAGDNVGPFNATMKAAPTQKVSTRHIISNAVREATKLKSK